VASTPTTPERLRSTAGLTAGSMATTGRAWRARSRCAAAPLAVLQATTMALAPWASRKSLMARARASMKSMGLSP